MSCNHILSFVSGLKMYRAQDPPLLAESTQRSEVHVANNSDTMHATAGVQKKAGESVAFCPVGLLTNSFTAAQVFLDFT